MRRWWILWILERIGFKQYVTNIAKRTNCYEVGFSGHGKSKLDDVLIERYNMKPLNRFEKWLMARYIVEMKKAHASAFKEACIEVLGEDPDDWGIY